MANSIPQVTNHEFSIGQIVVSLATPSIGGEVTKTIPGKPEYRSVVSIYTNSLWSGVDGQRTSLSGLYQGKRFGNHCLPNLNLIVLLEISTLSAAQGGVEGAD